MWPKVLVDKQRAKIAREKTVLWLAPTTGAWEEPPKGETSYCFTISLLMLAANGPLGGRTPGRVWEVMVLLPAEASVAVAVEAPENQAPAILQMPSAGPMVFMTGHILA